MPISPLLNDPAKPDPELGFTSAWWYNSSLGPPKVRRALARYYQLLADEMGRDAGLLRE